MESEGKAWRDERQLTIVSISYPFAPVALDPVGGAEQVLAQLDLAILRAGHRSIVIAPEGSAVAGELRAIGSVPTQIDDSARANAYRTLTKWIAKTMEQDRPDIIHMHGVDFGAYLPAPGPAVLVTLHLPLDWYGLDALRPERPRTVLHPVSLSQARGAPLGARIDEPIENGVELASVPARKRSFAVALGRICPEKGFVDAIDAAEGACIPLILAGKAFPYAEHQLYLRTRILPRLGRACQWIGAVAGQRKKQLLAEARCVLVPSNVPETSSLVAMEAIAAGTPVIAYRQGALPDIVEHGRTGFIVDCVEEMIGAIWEIDRIDPGECRARARERFSLEKMTGTYLARYEELARS
ncbi:MAG: glycosyltransferase family 4 protein [Rhodospirillales bacterium]|nr:glycosyltransferase family 4 protein [Rhodospirillales bacterium]